MEKNYIAGIVILVLVLIVVIYLRLKKLFKNRLTGGDMPSMQIMEIQVSKNVETENPQATSTKAEHMFASLHGLLKETPHLQEHISFELVSTGDGGIRFYVAIPSDVLKFVEGQIYAQYPEAQIKTVEDYTYKLHESGVSYDVAEVSLSRPNFYPIKTYKDFEVDPTSALTSAISELRNGEQIWVQYIVKPLPDVWQEEGFTYIDAVKAGESTKFNLGITEGIKQALVDILKEFLMILTQIPIAMFRRPSEEDRSSSSKPATEKVVLSVAQELELATIESKLSNMGFSLNMRIVSAAESTERVKSNMRHIMASLQQYSNNNTNSLYTSYVADKKVELRNYEKRYFDDAKDIILNTAELATIFHLPSSDIATPHISWTYSRKSEPPSNLPTKDCVYMGDTLYRSNKVRFGLQKGDDRLRHMYLIGKSGTGKSTLLETMMTQDIKNGEGVGILDPHGDTVEKILERIPDERIDDVVLIDPSDRESPVGLNLLEMNDPTNKNLMASGLVAAIKQHFDYSWGPRLEYLLNYAILTLLEVQGTTLLAITRLLEDANYRKYILHYVKDPVVKRFWEVEYKNMMGNQRLVTEAVAPIQNKVNRFLASTTIRNILGQRNSTVDFEDVMNNKKILLINLSKGKIGSDNANLLGALLVSRIQFYALQRANIPYEKRVPFYLYVDEFQNFATGSFEEILSESRKYKLGLYLTHQFTAQLPEELLKAVFGNVGTMAAFSLGAPDARALEYEFAPYFNAEDIISLERFQIYIKLMIDGMTSVPFSARIITPWDDENFPVEKTGNKERVIESSRRKHGSDREYVEQKINKWIDMSFDKGKAIAEDYKKKKVNNT